MFNLFTLLMQNEPSLNRATAFFFLFQQKKNVALILTTEKGKERNKEHFQF